jgi:hypothetical protein
LGVLQETEEEEEEEEEEDHWPTRTAQLAQVPPQDSELSTLNPKPKTLNPKA